MSRFRRDEENCRPEVEFKGQPLALKYANELLPPSDYT